MESAEPSPDPQPPSFGAVEDPQPAPVARIPRLRPLVLVGLLGWLVPGLGQLLMGRTRKALVMGVSICGLYASGLALAGFVCVNPSEFGLEFVAHVLAGGPTLLTLYLTEGLTQEVFLPHFDVGRLYVAVASLLNVVAVSDALGDALDHNDEVRRARERAEASSDILDAPEDTLLGDADHDSPFPSPETP